MSYHTSPASGSPDQSPPEKAIPLSDLDGLKSTRDAARAVSVSLRKDFETLDSKVNPVVAPNQDKPEPDFDESLALAKLGIDLASQEMQELELEKAIVAAERDEGSIKPHVAKRNMEKLQLRIFSAGEDLWRHTQKKMRLESIASGPLASDCRCGVLFSNCLLALYKKSDGQNKRRDKKKRPDNFRRDALQWYDGDGKANGQTPEDVWCHAIGDWQLKEKVKAAHIVPFFLESEALAEMLFGSRAPEVDREANALLLTSGVEKWFDSYHLVIVPVDTTETPVRRWRIELIDMGISTIKWNQAGALTGAWLHKRELTFRNENRPAARFLYFHFIMALVRIKDLNRPKWRNIWARYHDNRPFPTPGNYIRHSMLIALAKHSGTTDMATIGSWICENGFDTQLRLTPGEAEEAIRRVLGTVYRNASESDGSSARVVEVESGDESEDESEDESKDGSEDGSEGENDD